MTSKANLVATVAAVRVGRVRAHHWNGREIYTGADKDDSGDEKSEMHECLSLCGWVAGVAGVVSCAALAAAVHG